MVWHFVFWQNEVVLRQVTIKKGDEMQVESVADSRVFARLLCRVKISIHNLSRDFEDQTRCVNVSGGGVCIESKKMFFPGEDLRLWIHCGDNLPPIQRYGTVVWCKKMFGSMFKIGVKFKSQHFSGIHRLLLSTARLS